MASIIAQQMDEIVSLLGCNPEGLSRGEIAEFLTFPINEKTLQRRLQILVGQQRIARRGDKRIAKYYPVGVPIPLLKGQNEPEQTGMFSQESRNVLKFLDSPLHSRKKVSYSRRFLEEYVPNETAYVPKKVRDGLLREGRRFDKALAAGTYARQICQRLLIDLSYNSSRLEGNTYSRLDTQKLLEEGISAEGKIQEETVMIMNHKEAILFLVENAQAIELNSFTLYNLHNLLAQDLLANPEACGNIRTVDVDIGQSAYKPLNNPHLLRECFELVLQKAKKIEDPFEQSFFLLVHLSYLQAFEDVNKRTSRLSCNIPFIKHNLCPLSFIDVSREDYTAALLAIYELNAILPLLELFCWAYLRSCNQYGVAKQSLGEIDAFRVQYRGQRKEIMGIIIREGLRGTAMEKRIADYCTEHQMSEIDKFTAMTLADLATLHAGAIVGLGISEAQLNAWLGTTV